MHDSCVCVCVYVCLCAFASYVRLEIAELDSVCVWSNADLIWGRTELRRFSLMDVVLLDKKRSFHRSEVGFVVDPPYF